MNISKAILWSSIVATALAHASLPIGMNIGGIAYWEHSPYNDPLRASGGFFSYSEGTWDSQQMKSIPVDANGYPLKVPVTVSATTQYVRAMVNTCRAGEYELRYEGDGDISFSGSASAVTKNNKTIVTMNGSCEHGWMDITRSNEANPIKNLQLIPVEYAKMATPPLFDSLFVHGLRPFHALRFMDWMSTNGSMQSTWASRARPSEFAYGIGKGAPIEHAIELANMLNADPWFCVPANADDDYIRKFATLVRDNLNSNLKVYVEYSNEVWNWGFSQSHFVGTNGYDITWENDTIAMAADTIRTQLAAVGVKYCQDAKSYCHPEKDAYMMNRTFRIWKSVFATQAATRLVRVATGQHAWYDNSTRILKYLFTDGDGADALSVGGYFNFEEDDHLTWNAMNPNAVTPEMILDSVFDNYDETSGLWTRESAKIAREYKVDYFVYEGGQHMQPYMQGEYDYNQSVWNAQIHPRMYDLYMKNFDTHVENTVNCKLFMAFSYAGARESKYGSWGHLESFEQSLLTGSALKTAAPKYAALLDANTGKGTGSNRANGLRIHRPTLAKESRVVWKNNSPLVKTQDANGTIRYYTFEGIRIP